MWGGIESVLNGGSGGGWPGTTSEEVFVDVDDFDFVIDVVEGDGVVSPVVSIVINGAFVMAGDFLAGSGERVDFAGVDLFADLFDQHLDVVVLNFIERRHAVPDVRHFAPNFFLAGRVEAGRCGGVAGDGVEDGNSILGLFPLDVVLEFLLRRSKNRIGERGSVGMDRRDVSEYVSKTAADHARGHCRQQDSDKQSAYPSWGEFGRTPVPRGSGHGELPSWEERLSTGAQTVGWVDD